MDKIHMCCGTVYLDGYINCDIRGCIADEVPLEELELNVTTLDNYFKYPFEKDKDKRTLRRFIVDKRMDILKKWSFNDNSISEIVMVNAFEHFEHKIEIPHIINEAHRVLCSRGTFKFDFPNIAEIVDYYLHRDPEFCMALLYGTHKDGLSKHEWGYTIKSIQKYFNKDMWKCDYKNVVKHDYPSQGIWLTKI